MFLSTTNFEVMDFSLCSPSLLFNFIDYLHEECKLGHGGRLGYIDAISELIDFRKVNRASDGVLRKLSATELYIKRARKTVAKMMRLQSLDARSRCRNIRGQGSLGHHRRTLSSRVVSLASLRTNRENVPK